MNLSRLRLAVMILVVLESLQCERRWDAGRQGPAAAAPGPWGTLEVSEIELAPAEELVRLGTEAECGRHNVRWILPGHSRNSIARLFDAAEVKGEARTALLGSLTGCNEGARPSCSFDVSVDLLSRLRPASRTTLYRELAREPRNVEYAFAFPVRPEHLSRWLAELHLPQAARSQVRDLMYLDRGVLRFADFQLMCSRLASLEERADLLRAINQTRSLLVRLRIASGAPIDDLAAYWGSGTGRQDLRPLLEALSRHPGGSTVDVIELLPPFPRSKLYTYAPITAPRSCFYSAFNFFAETPEDRYRSRAEISAAAKNEYIGVSRAELRLGDVILFRHKDGTMVHAANYIADDIVFTKNGVSPLRPYTLARLSEMRILYPECEEVYLRRRRPTLSLSAPSTPLEQAPDLAPHGMIMGR